MFNIFFTPSYVLLFVCGFYLIGLQNFIQAQVRLPSKIFTSIINETNDARRTNYIGLLGDGSVSGLSKTQDLQQSLNAGGGFFFGQQLGQTDVKTGYLSVIAKYKPINEFRKFAITDSTTNKDITVNGITQRMFSFDNANDFSISARYNQLKKISNGEGLAAFSFLAEVFFSPYKAKIDSSQIDTLAFFHKKLSSGFTLISFNLGLSKDWLWRKNDFFWAIGFSALVSGTTIYETDKDSKTISSWDYLLYHSAVINQPSKNLNYFGCLTGRFNLSINDVNLFIGLQKVFSTVKGIELIGINNRPLFVTWGVSFSPVLLGLKI